MKRNRVVVDPGKNLRDSNEQELNRCPREPTDRGLTESVPLGGTTDRNTRGSLLVGAMGKGRWPFG